MKIEITTNEYRDLLDILHIADVMLSGHRHDPDKRSAGHRVLIQKLYALATAEGLDRLIRYEAQANVHVPTKEFEDRSLAHVLLNEFVDHTFWDELIARLSVRDAARVVGGMDRLQSLSSSDRMAAEAPIRQRYIDEFSRNGVANLTLIDRFDAGGREPVITSD